VRIFEIYIDWWRISGRKNQGRCDWRGMRQKRNAYRVYVKPKWEAREQRGFKKLKWVKNSRVSIGFNWLRSRVRYKPF